MRYCIGMVLILAGFSGYTQENYRELTRKALEIMWKARDDTGYRKALDQYEEAFRIYPDSIDETGLYKASVLASNLKDADKAFSYLESLAGAKTGEGALRGWTYIVGNYSEGEYKNLLSDVRWNILKVKALEDKKQFYSELKEKEAEFYSIQPHPLPEIMNAEELYREIRNFNPYKQKENRNYSVSFRINDSAATSFFIRLPRNYTPEKKYPLLFFLHGAVRSNALTDYQLAEWNLGGWNRYYTRYADQNEVILVFPKGSRQYNWMIPDDGFSMVPDMLRQIKKAIHVDDNRVFISGHSNGATGSFSYLMKQPAPFAGFYGFNAYPRVFTGGTFVENIKNRSFISFSTDQDYYYPPAANDSFTRLMHEIGADYKEYRYRGFPHAFPKFDESEPAYEILFRDLENRKRNPFPREISWEFDQDKYGNADWLADMKSDTLLPAASWHRELNFKISEWLEYDKNDSLVTRAVDRKAFDFPRKSGKVRAQYDNNVFRLETSRVKRVSVLVSPEMVNLEKKIKIYINGKLCFNEKVRYDRAFMLENFEAHHDRGQVWVKRIELKI